MMSLLASVATGFGMLFAGLFGGHQGPPAGMASTTPGQMMGSTTMQHMGGGMDNRMPGIEGKIISISGSTFTMNGYVPGTRMSSTTSLTTYTVDASNSKVMKYSATHPIMTGSTTSMTLSGTAMSVSNLAVGDNVFVRGTVSGTSITAVSLVYGVPAMPAMQPMSAGQGGMHGMRGMNASSSMMMSSGNKNPLP
jgi:hypothetical protein